MKKNTQTVIKAGTYYTITGSTGRIVEAVESDANGAYVVLGNYDHAANQEWAFVRAGEGVYQIVNRGTGKMLDLVSGGTSDGTWLHQWEDAACSSQLWMVEPTNDGRVKLKAQLAQDKCVDVVGMSTDLGAQLQIWQDVDGENQTWVISTVMAKRARATKTPEEKAAAAAKRAETAAKKAAKAAAEGTAVAPKATAKKAAAPKTTKAAPKKAAAKPAAKAAPKAAVKTTTKAAAPKAATTKAAVKKETTK
ncbi:MAG: RICIN domain-containing protein [Faecalibacterium sp.]